MTRSPMLNLMSLAIGAFMLILSIFSLIDLGQDYFKLQDNMTNYGDRIYGLSEHYPHASELLLPLLPYVTYIAIFMSSVFLFGITSSIFYLIRRSRPAAYALGLSCTCYGLLSIFLSFVLSKIHAAILLDGNYTSIPEAQPFIVISTLLFILAGGVAFLGGAGHHRALRARASLEEGSRLHTKALDPGGTSERGQPGE